MDIIAECNTVNDVCSTYDNSHNETGSFQVHFAWGDSSLINEAGSIQVKLAQSRPLELHVVVVGAREASMSGPVI